MEFGIYVSDENLELIADMRLVQVFLLNMKPEQLCNGICQLSNVYFCELVYI